MPGQISPISQDTIQMQNMQQKWRAVQDSVQPMPVPFMDTLPGNQDVGPVMHFPKIVRYQFIIKAYDKLQNGTLKEYRMIKTFEKDHLFTPDGPSLPEKQKGGVEWPDGKPAGEMITFPPACLCEWKEINI